ncbi:hypothetical protein SLS62_007813 [Diatrype stigma]|uniref:Phenylacetaldoxime dehydratase n=1 Tax=Diatrype stigma TaxID=117547 RepID=A0AAN9UM58_9PEZI
MLESAIPAHLRQERTQPARAPSSGLQQPAYPSYSARFPTSAKDLVMAVIGVQYASKSDAEADVETGAGISKLMSFTKHTSSSSSSPTAAPSFAELASATDSRGFFNVAVLAYWTSRATYDAWAAASGFDVWWASLDRPQDEAEEEQGRKGGGGGDGDTNGETRRGWFREVFFPSMDRLETIFTDDQVPEGAGHLGVGSISGPVREHGYWGSMRDRLPIAQTDALAGEKWTGGGTEVGGAERCSRVRVPGKKNLAIIRSGQDWSATRSEERTLYLETMHPVLARGMGFLRDRGGEVGCYSCRFMDVVGEDDQNNDSTDRTFGLAYFDELASLEAWSREHQTHLDIFRGFFRYARSLDNSIGLRLFHEVLVLEPEQQLFEYIGCHGGTGMLASLA